MPDVIRQIRPVLSAVLLTLLGALLAACSGGDFGRTRESMRSDDMHRWLGAEVTSSVGLRPSQFQHSSRYAQLIEDVRNDITRFEPFFASAIRVIDLDRKRDASMARVSALSPRERDDAVARMQENSLIIQWVQQCLEQRISSYRWALERLVIQAPDGMAADADRLIGELAAQTANPPVQGHPPYGRAVVSKG